MDNNIFLEEVRRCVAALEAGSTILYPTDTVWGIGCDALDSAAVARIFDLKERSHQKSMIVLLSDVSELEAYTGPVSPKLLDLICNAVEPTTVIFSQGRQLPDNVINEDGSIAIRVTRDPFCKAVISRLGHPLISTSANKSGAPAASVYRDIDSAIINGVDYVVQYRQDDERVAAPSRIVRLDEQGQLVYLR